jgi:putative transcriptional regulator
MAMKKYKSLEHTFLIAMPHINDDYFSHSVVYLAEYSAHGAKGIIINKPLKNNLGDLMRHLKIPVRSKKASNHPLLMGGPVASDQAFLLQRKYDVDFKTGAIRLQIEIFSTKDDLEPLAHGKRLKDTLVTVGYAKWEAGQLDEELKNNDWLVAPFDPEILFSVLYKDANDVSIATETWYDAAAHIGINLDNLSFEAGNA